MRNKSDQDQVVADPRGFWCATDRGRIESTSVPLSGRDPAPEARLPALSVPARARGIFFAREGV
jgi:hypothetical protein